MCAFILKDREPFESFHCERGTVVNKRFIKNTLRNHPHAVPRSQTDWAAVDSLTGDTIDYSDIPPLPHPVVGRVEIIFPRTLPRRRVRATPRRHR